MVQFVNWYIILNKTFVIENTPRSCASWVSGTTPLVIPPNSCHTTFVPERHPMFDELWSEIQDAPGEIFDIPELREDEDFNLNEYLNSNIDY